MAIQAKQTAITLGKIIIAVALIGWIVRSGAIDFKALARLITPLNVLVAAAIVFLQLLLNNQRWYLLLRSQKVETTPWRCLNLSLIGQFFNFAVPGGTGGDIIKAFYVIQDHPEHKIHAAVSVVLDRVIGLFVVILVAAVAFALNWNAIQDMKDMRTLASALFALLGALSLVIAILGATDLWRHPKLLHMLEKIPGGKLLIKLSDSLVSFRSAPGALVGGVLLTIVGQLSTVVFVYLLGHAMGFSDIPFSAYCFLVPTGMLVSSLPIAPAGIGLGQAAFFVLFKMYLGVETPVGATAVTALQVTYFAWGLFGAYFYMRRGKPVADGRAFNK